MQLLHGQPRPAERYIQQSGALFVLFSSDKEQLAVVMERHGIEWEDKDTYDKLFSVPDHKKEQRVKEAATLEMFKTVIKL